MRAPTRAMVLGKFMPPHRGHQYLLEFAQAYVDELYVVVGTLAAEPIPGELRFRWMKELMPNAQVLHLTDENPQLPEEHPDFWDIWRSSLTRILPEPIDYVFASDDYGERLAEELEARFVQVDPGRALHPVSGTQCRQDPWRHWESITEPARPYFLRRVCICGPESTGKSTLTEQLARHYETVWVPEYARARLEAKGGECTLEDMLPIARGQIASEDALASRARRFLFCDTDARATCLWSETLFGRRPGGLTELAQSRRHDLYLLLEPDLPWVEDEVRYLPGGGRAFYDALRSALEAADLPFVSVGGQGQARFDAARRALDERFA